MSGGGASFVELLGHVAARADLSREQARQAMSHLLRGETTPAQTGAFLVGLRVKGETEAEVTGLVEGMREAAVKIAPARRPLLDLCGTGGDGLGTFNISTAAALVAAGAGAAVAKHGNRSASSRAGSADVLEALGVPIDLPPERASAAVDEIGFAFLFAPLYHPAMKHVGPVRKELKLRTVFNLLGPLSSPAGADHQLVGVHDDGARGLMARVLAALGARRAWVVHGDGGVDEMSIAGPTRVAAAESGMGASQELLTTPADAGLTPSPLSALEGGDARDNAAIIERVLGGERGPCRDATVLNAGAALAVAGLCPDLREGAARAAEAIDCGGARRVLEAARRFR